MGGGRLAPTAVPGLLTSLTKEYDREGAGLRIPVLRLIRLSPLLQVSIQEKDGERSVKCGVWIGR